MLTNLTELYLGDNKEISDITNENLEIYDMIKFSFLKNKNEKI